MVLIETTKVLAIRSVLESRNLRWPYTYKCTLSLSVHNTQQNILIINRVINYAIMSTLIASTASLCHSMVSNA